MYVLNSAFCLDTSPWFRHSIASYTDKYSGFGSVESVPGSLSYDITKAVARVRATRTARIAGCMPAILNLRAALTRRNAGMQSQYSERNCDALLALLNTGISTKTKEITRGRQGMTQGSRF
jgi:hypothetical protein